MAIIFDCLSEDTGSIPVHGAKKENNMKAKLLLNIKLDRPAFKTLPSELEFYSLGHWSTSMYDTVEEYKDSVVVHLPCATYTVERYLDGFSLTGNKIHELYSSTKDIAARLFEIHKNSYEQPKIQNGEAWLIYPKYVKDIIAKMKGEIVLPALNPLYSNNDEIGFDIAGIPLIEGSITPREIALRYFPHAKISGGYNMVFDLNIYANKVAKHTRLARANAMLINPKLYYTINRLMARDDAVTDTCKGHYDMSRYNWIQFDEKLPENMIIVYIDQVTQPCSRSFVITEHGYALSPIIEYMGFVLEITDENN